MRSDDQVSEAWLTGIQEVELPIEYLFRLSLRVRCVCVRVTAHHSIL